MHQVPEADTHAHASDLPKLPQRSGISRMIVVFFCVSCVALGSWGATALVILPALHHLPSSTPKPLPTMLRRFSHLKRAPPGTGIDALQVRTYFPHWQNDEGFKPEVVLYDVALAIAQLTAYVAPPPEPFPEYSQLDANSHTEGAVDL